MIRKKLIHFLIPALEETATEPLANLWKTKMAMENGPIEDIFLLKIGIFKNHIGKYVLQTGEFNMTAINRSTAVGGAGFHP